MRDPSRVGVGYGLAAYLIWGGMPVYFLALAPAGAWEILANRVLWSLLLCVILLAATRAVRATLGQLSDWRTLAGVSLAGCLIAANWTIYVVAVTSGRVTEAALGYFLNPLLSVALGLIVLRERLRSMQWAAVVIGGLGAAYLALAEGRPSWIALGLASSFGLYGLIKKRMGVTLGALPGLTAETVVLAPVAVAVLAVLAGQGALTFGGAGAPHAAALASTGVVTAVPLLLFAASARRIPLVTVGFLQFVAPILQFGTGLALGEQMTTPRWTGFAVVWVALVLLVLDAARNEVQARRDRRVPAGVETADGQSRHARPGVGHRSG
ncbi:MAG TPA: EamA family transporter RarD [Dermatophilaceae bacterium]|nr:EamA family transporter RarD [Dermatophilaceae bacterium]